MWVTLRPGSDGGVPWGSEMILACRVWRGMSCEELLALVGVQAETIESLKLRVAWLERQLAADSTNSSHPPSADAPWTKKRRRNDWRGPGRVANPGKQSGSISVSRRLVDDADAAFEVGTDRYERCEESLAGAQETSRSAVRWWTPHRLRRWW